MTLGSWSLYVLHECEEFRFNDEKRAKSWTPARVRYAFVTARDDGTVVAADADGFFASVGAEQAGDLASKWKTNMAAMEPSCDPEHAGSRHFRPEMPPQPKGQVSCANSAEVEEGLALAKAYNEEIGRHIAMANRRFMAQWTMPEGVQ